MKLCKKNWPKDNELWEGAEPDYNYQNRIHVLVADDFDFNANADEDVSGDVLAWEAHYERLKINFMHFYKVISGVILAKTNSQFPLVVDWDNFDTLTDGEKRVAVQYLVHFGESFIPESTRIEDNEEVRDSWKFSSEKDRSNWDFVLKMTKEGREGLEEQMRERVGDFIPSGDISLTDTQIFFRDLWPKTLYWIQTNDPEFKAWLCSTDSGGYDHTLDGFSSKTYHTQEIEDSLVEIYDGNHYKFHTL